MTAEEIYFRFIAVRKCGGCRGILGYERAKDTFCEKCAASWSFEKNRGCKNCFKSAVECECMPKTLSKAGALCLRRLFFYESEEPDKPGMRMIYLLKRKKNRRMSRFVASELEAAVRQELAPLELDAEDIIVSWIPRNRASRAVYGFDQSEEVAKELAALIGAPHKRLLRARAFGKEQKSLDGRERLRNAKKHIVLARGSEAEGKYVLLYDDMVTTGASMATAVERLKKVGVKGVLCFSMSSSIKKDR